MSSLEGSQLAQPWFGQLEGFGANRQETSSMSVGKVVHAYTA